LKKSIDAVLANGKRLIAEARDYLSYETPPATAYFLVQIAQEEFAKAFLLEMVRRGVIPWSNYILRATRDHICKQLVCLVMEYLSPDDERFFNWKPGVVEEVPQSVYDAIQVLRYERIGGWEPGGCCLVEPINYEKEPLAVLKGNQDRFKQRTLYVSIDRNGKVSSQPGTGISAESLEAEIEKAKRLEFIVDTTHDHRIVEAFRLLFERLKDK
jgi:hypothetical protein